MTQPNGSDAFTQRDHPHVLGSGESVFRWTAVARDMFRAIEGARGTERPYQTQWTVALDRHVNLARLTDSWRRLWYRHADLLLQRPPGAPQANADTDHAPAPNIEFVESEDVAAALDRAWLAGSGYEYDRAPIELLVIRGKTSDTVAFTKHHAYADGGGTTLLLREVLAPALQAEHAESVEERAFEGATDRAPSFRSYAQWLEAASSAVALQDFWKERLSGAEIGAGIEWLAGDAHATAGLIAVTTRRFIGASVTAALKSNLDTLRVRPSTATHLAAGLLLSSGAGAPSAVFGSVRAMRDIALPGVKAMLGNLIGVVGVRVDRDEDATIGALLQRMRRDDRAGREHAGIALNDLQRCARAHTGRPLEMLLVHNDATRIESAAADLGLDCVRDVFMRQEAATPLVLIVGFGRTIEVDVRFDPRRVSAHRAQAFADRFVALLHEFAADTQRPLRAIPMATAEETTEALRVGNGGAALGEGLRLDDLFRLSCERTPHAVAVSDLATRLTYSQVEQRARVLAHALLTRSSSRGDPIGICMGRDVALAACHIGCWYAGHFFVPLDPTLPAERLRTLVTQAGISIIIGRPQDCAAFAEMPLHQLDPAMTGEALSLADIPARDPTDLAYGFFTSGSSGAPKLALVRHEGVANYLLALQQSAALPSVVNTLALTPIGFDPSIIETHLALITGGTVGVANSGMHLDFAQIARMVEGNGVHYLTLVPAVLTRMIESVASWEATQFRSVVMIACGGETMPAGLPAAVAHAFGSCGIRLFNVYGPTECSIGVTGMELDASAVAPFPIGAALPGVRLRVVDSELRTLPLGAHGELIISGVQVGQGYRGDAATTAAKFIDANDGSGVSYRTGDRVSMNEVGIVSFHGRMDFQFKVRGVRVEAGEIEHLMCEVSGVESAIVWYHGDGIDRKVVGYFKVRAGELLHGNESEALKLVTRIRAHLSARLAAQVVPSTCIAVDEWPLSVNGKVDRRQLPAPTLAHFQAHGQAPTVAAAPTIAERNVRARVAELFAEILQVGSVESGSSFFELGGDSLSAVLLIDRLSAEFGVAPGIADLLADPTPVAIALQLCKGGAVARIEPVVAIGRSDAHDVLHCFPGIGGLSAFTYLPLAGELVRECRVLGYQLMGASDGERATLHLRGAAARLASRVEANSGGKPIHLVGFSFGGIMAFEVAAQLETRGIRVASVSVLDTAPLGKRERFNRVARTALRYMGLSNASKRLKKLNELANVRTVNGASLGEVEHRLRRVMDVSGLSLAFHRLGRVSCPLNIILSNGIDIDGESVSEARVVERWSKYAHGEVRITRTTSSHNGLVRKEGVPAVAGVLRRVLSTQSQLV